MECERKAPKPDPETKEVPIDAGRLAYSIKETAKAIGVSYTTVRELIHQGRIDNFPIGKRIIIPKTGLLNFIEDNLVQAKETKTKNDEL